MKNIKGPELIRQQCDQHILYTIFKCSLFYSLIGWMRHTIYIDLANEVGKIKCEFCEKETEIAQGKKT